MIRKTLSMPFVLLAMLVLIIGGCLSALAAFIDGSAAK